LPQSFAEQLAEQIERLLLSCWKSVPYILGAGGSRFSGLSSMLLQFDGEFPPLLIIGG